MYFIAYGDIALPLTSCSHAGLSMLYIRLCLVVTRKLSLVRLTYWLSVWLSDATWQSAFFLCASTMFDFDFCNALPVRARVGSGTIIAIYYYYYFVCWFFEPGYSRLCFIAVCGIAFIIFFVLLLLCFYTTLFILLCLFCLSCTVCDFIINKLIN